MLYFVQRKDGAIKIGISKQFGMRVYCIEREYGRVKTLGLMDGGHVLETSLHRRFAAYRTHGRMGGQEWFLPCPELMQYIEENAYTDVPEFPRIIYYNSARRRLSIADEARLNRLPLVPY